ncbi:regulatory protein-like protein suaprga1 [Decorospora gaudefroyi]|uniref:Regulatory protein-like protein suaprga1 n=1 Tax=Decorospora gaudefroyi TaxID=184978 RepID=A0A6A5KW26_9PLEO|nr:regulatory protein-like protein suaprga1 [Decorospora gaudefroyi]
MLGLRNLARAAPRSAARLSTKAIRPASLRQSAAFQPAWAVPIPRLAASFHMSAVRRQDGGVNEELVAKLQSEISMEEDMKEDEDLSANIKEYLENSPFEIEDKVGNQEVVLTRQYNDEKIRITFTTADLNNNTPGEELGEDNAMYDDADMDVQSGGANTKGAINQGNTRDGNVRVAPEDRIAPADREELEDDYEDESQQQGFPARASIRIERAGKGALAIEATAQDGDFLIEDLYYFSKADLADPQTAEKDWSRRALYTGPPFNNLDEDLQILLEKYLEERGINTRLALFIPDYIDHKEQKEYIRWLNNVKTFVS